VRLDSLPTATVPLADVPEILLGERSTPGLKVIVDVGRSSG
jgi:hypothetical protein